MVEQKEKRNAGKIVSKKWGAKGAKKGMFYVMIGFWE